MVQIPGGGDCPLTGATEVMIQTAAAHPATVIKANCDTADDFLSTAVSPQNFSEKRRVMSPKIEKKQRNFDRFPS
jgi:hypothetical protein